MFAGTPKITYRQLEKENRELKKQQVNGKDLIMRVSKRLMTSNDEARALDAQLRVCNAILAIMIQRTGEEGVIVSKEAISETLNSKTVAWIETEEKELRLFVKEIPKNDQNDTGAVEGVSNEGQVETGEGIGNTESNTETKQVPKRKARVKRDNVPLKKRSLEVRTIVDATEGEAH